MSNERVSKEYFPERSMSIWRDWLTRYSNQILIFLTLLFILILINRPALIMDDETITTNQLHQISMGHQFLMNECKYGCFSDGTPALYYIYRNNVLGYPIILPLLSLPVYMIIHMFGDNFRLPIIIFWSMIPALLCLCLQLRNPQKISFNRIPIMYIGLFISLILLLINFYYYHPFPLTPPDAPSETGAVILTNTLLGALLGVIIYQMNKLIFKRENIALIATIALISCSSYLFWAGTAKDHILTTTLFAIITLSFISSIHYDSIKYRVVGFIFIGFLAWARPEMGFSLFICALLYQGFEWAYLEKENRSYPHSFLLPFIGTAFGSIPLFINNYITTHNFLIPAFYYYHLKTAPVGFPVFIPNNLTTGSAQAGISMNTLTSTFNLWDICYLFMQILPKIEIHQLFFAIIAIFLYPPPGNISIALLSPVLLLGIMIWCIIIVFQREKIQTITREHKNILMLLTFFSIAIFLPYVHVLEGYIEGGRPGPDVRYFLPIYFIGGLIGMYPIITWCKECLCNIWKKNGLIKFCGFTVLISLFIVIFEPFGGPGYGYYPFFIAAVYGLTIVSLLLFIKSQQEIQMIPCISALILLLVSLPLIWQLIISYYFAIGRFNGYPYWLPFLEYIYELYVPYSWK